MILCEEQEHISFKRLRSYFQYPPLPPGGVVFFLSSLIPLPCAYRIRENQSGNKNLGRITQNRSVYRTEIKPPVIETNKKQRDNTLLLFFPGNGLAGERSWAETRLVIASSTVSMVKILFEPLSCITSPSSGVFHVSAFTRLARIKL